MSETYLIWSNEHRLWWRPNSQGYTALVSEAGRYSEKQAFEICRLDYKSPIPDEVPVHGFPGQQLDVEVEALRAVIDAKARREGDGVRLVHRLCLEKQELREQVDMIESTAAQLLTNNFELVDALDRIWVYAATGASMSDVDTREQPEFAKVRALLAKHGRPRP